MSWRPDDRDALAAQLRVDEGVEATPYVDTVGKITIGVGRNLTDRGLSGDEIDYLLHNDIDLVLEEMARAFPWALRLDMVRQQVLANMLFNLGVTRLRGFRHTLTCMQLGDYEAAAKGMLASLWAEQVGGRAVRLASEMRTGVKA